MDDINNIIKTRPSVSKQYQLSLNKSHPYEILQNKPVFTGR